MYLQKTKKYFPYLLIFVLISIIYSNTLNFGYNLDDQLVYSALPNISKGLAGYKDIFSQSFAFQDYRPINVSSIYTEYLILGNFNPQISHGINVVLYILLCCSIYYLLQLLPFENSKATALIITLLFACHPIHANVVSSIKSRDNILSMWFSILALITFVKILDKKKWMLFLGVLLLSFIAILSKLDAYYLIFIIPYIYYLQNTSDKKTILISLVFGVLIFSITLLLRGFLIPESQEINNPFLQNSITENPYFNNLNWVNVLKLLGVSFFYYLKFMFIPWGYYFYFGTGSIDVTSFFSFTNILGIMLFLLFSVLAFYYGIIRKTYIGFATLWFIFSLLYCLNIFTPIAGIVSERYAFIASLGFFILLGNLLLYLDKKYNFSIKYLTLIIVIVYSFFSYSRSKDWKDIDTLLSSDMPHLAKSYEANRIASSNYIDLSLGSQNKNHIEKAIFYANSGRKVYDNETFLLEAKGTAYYLLGNLQSAKECFVQVANFDTLNSTAQVSLGDIYYAQKKFELAARHYENGYNINPDIDLLSYKIVDSYCRIESFSKADSINKIIKIESNSPYIYNENNGYISLYKKDTLSAAKYFKLAFEDGLRDENLYKLVNKYIK